MKATAKHCQKELERLGTLPTPFGVDRSTLVIELTQALMRNSHGNEHANRVIQRAVDTFTVCPTPAELISLCREVNVDDKGLPEPCRTCAPDGGYWVHQVVVKDVGFGTQEYHYSGRCYCARGQVLAAKDRELQAKIDYAHV